MAFSVHLDSNKIVNDWVKCVACLPSFANSIFTAFGTPFNPLFQQHPEVRDAPKSSTHFVDITLRSLKGRIHLEGCKGERALPHGMSEEDHLVLEPFARYALSAIKSLRLLSSGTAGTDEDLTNDFWRIKEPLCTRQMLQQNPLEYLSFVLCHALLLAKQWSRSIFRQ